SIFNTIKTILYYFTINKEYISKSQYGIMTIDKKYFSNFITIILIFIFSIYFLKFPFSFNFETYIRNQYLLIPIIFIGIVAHSLLDLIKDKFNPDNSYFANK